MVSLWFAVVLVTVGGVGFGLGLGFWVGRVLLVGKMVPEQ